MFKFLKFGRGKKPEAVIETQRQTFERLVGELNEAIASLPEMPAVTVTPVTNEISFALPEQFPDEALALPAPEPVPEIEVVEEAAEDVVEAAAEDVSEEVKAEVVEQTKATTA
ncbi:MULTISPECIES: hypothetical protein [Pacificibacter]|uniref:hypothetical protein n=1 Tax=Pacificibacter TaxID=1042323 RepID=UPI001C0A0FF7|nr:MULTISPECIES: hypothetical protein [Pacificibacter]MBU2936527.1 hypothetical protein [Pacificibacter marinus]MDO6614671.1 hypothetical protein [Pacificibacter sp. 1_MG-2023]